MDYKLRWSDESVKNLEDILDGIKFTWTDKEVDNFKSKLSHYELLNKVTTQRNWRDWILYILKAIEETSIYTINKIEEIDQLFNKIWALVQEKQPTIRKEVVEKIFIQPYISPKSLLDSNIRSLNTAKKYLGQLQELGIMIPEKIGKEIVYLNIDLFNLLSET